MDRTLISATPSALAVLIGAGLLVWLLTKRSKQHLDFPPGPKPLPVIGNLLDMPHDKEWLVYQQWAHKYGERQPGKSIKYSQTHRISGDVMHVEALGQHIIILNSVESANELFERRSSTYSDRPEAVMLNNL